MYYQDSLFIAPYLTFNRQQWSTLHNSTSTVLSEREISCLRSINKDLSLEEVSAIYLPLSHLLNVHINSNLRDQIILKKFLNINWKKIPYIISITGSVAVGKSTTSRILQTLLSRWPEHSQVDLITTDSFLHSNAVLKERGLMKKKGFPESYDMHSLINFITNLKLGAKKVIAPIYSHLIYDIIPNKNKIIQQPDILILEGLNVLQNNTNYLYNSDFIFSPNLIDFSIYIDAPENLLEHWYINRFLKLRRGTFINPDSYIHSCIKLGEEKAINTATKLWYEINYRNLKENILPTREYVSLILKKKENHEVEKIKLQERLFVTTF